MKRTTSFMLAAALALVQTPAPAVPTAAASAATAPPACSMAALQPAVKDDSPGMGRLGIDLTLANRGSSRCVLGPVTIAFQNPKPPFFGALRRISGSMLSLAPGYAAMTQVVWSDGIGGNGPCGDATMLAVGTGRPGPARTLPIRAHICALHTAKPSFTALPFSLVKR